MDGRYEEVECMNCGSSDTVTWPAETDDEADMLECFQCGYEEAV